MNTVTQRRIDDLLAEARSRISRYSPQEAEQADVVLVELGFERAGDLAGGFEAWRDAGLPVAAAPAPADGLPGMGGAQ